MAERALPETPIFVDSPLATRATAIFDKYVEGGIGGDRVRFVQDGNESRNLNRFTEGAIILAGSGMCDAGRIRHHLKMRLHMPSTTVLLVGYQAPGTLGSLLLAGRPMVRIQGEEVAVAACIRSLDDYSGHADQTKLVEWIRARAPIRNDIFVVHGEEQSRAGLAAHINPAKPCGGEILSPAMGDTFRLSHGASARIAARPRLTSANVIRADWHNQLADLTLRLRARLTEAKTEQERSALLEELGRVVGDGERRR